MQCPKCGIDTRTVGRCGCEFTLETQPRLAPSERFSMFGTTFEGARIVQSPAAENARQHVTRSWLLACAAPLIALAPLLWNRVSVLDSLALMCLSAYVAWATYWGTVGVSNFLMGQANRRGAEAAMHFAAHRLGTYALVVVPLTLGILYGTLGGGMREFLKHRRVVRNPGLAVP